MATGMKRTARSRSHIRVRQGDIASRGLETGFCRSSKERRSVSKQCLQMNSLPDSLARAVLAGLMDVR